MAELPVLETRLVSIADLTPHPRNYNVHPEQQIEQLMESLTRFGQVKPIVVQDGSPLLLVAGHGVAGAATRLGWETIEAKIIPGSWSDLEVEGYLIADNFISATAEENQVKLVEIIQKQQKAGKSLGSIGHTSESLARLISKTALAQEAAINKAAQLASRGDDSALGASKQSFVLCGKWKLPVDKEEKALIDKLIARYKSLETEEGFITWLCSE